MSPSKNVRAAGGRHGSGAPLVCVPSAEDLFEGWFYDNRSASKVIKLLRPEYR